MSSKPLFGYLVPTRDAVMRAPDGRADVMRMIDLAVESEKMGFDSIWLGDSLLARPRFEALTTLAAIAVRTSRAQLGTAVYLTPLRHPVPLAHTVGNLDLISGGRLLFGIGLGPASPPVIAEYEASGVDFRKRGRLQEEGLQIMKGLWTGKRYSFEGQLFTVSNATLHPLPARPGGPPVLMAGAAEPALRRLARFADGWLPISPHPEEFAKNWELIRKYCKEFGRKEEQLQRILYVTLNVNEDEGAADHEMEDFLLAYYGDLHDHISSWQAIRAGTPERCAEFLQGFVNVGVTHFVVRFASSSQKPQMERFLKQVAPQLHGAE